MVNESRTNFQRPHSKAARAMFAVSLLLGSFMGSFRLAPPAMAGATGTLGPGLEGDGQWRPLNPPPARSTHSAVWNPAARQMLVLGGRSGTDLGDLWAYRPFEDSWAQLRPSGPAPTALSGHTAVWDPQGSQMLVYGGYGPGQVGRLWSYRPTENLWTELLPSPPTPFPRGYHSAVWDPGGRQMLVFGGIGPSFNLLNDVWAYRPETNSWSALEAEGLRPLPVLFHSAVWDPSGSRMLVFGGIDPLGGQPTNELWSYQPASGTWTELAPEGPRPAPRLSHAALWDPTGSRMLLFGGSCGADCFLQDLWSYRPAENLWTELPSVGQRPQGRGGHTAIWEAGSGLMLVFAGTAQGRTLSDLWSYRPATYTWTPMARERPAFLDFSRHRAVWDQARGQMLVYESVLRRLFWYRPVENTWTEVVPLGPSPSPREDPSLTWDPEGERMLLLGGYWAGRFLDELWSYRPSENRWSRIAPAGPGPPGRFRHSAVWQPGGQLLVFGGYREGPLADLWSYRPATNSWSQLSASGPPPPRSDHAAVWDPVGNQMLLFGGLRGQPLDDLWAYRPDIPSWVRLRPSGPAPPRQFQHSALWDPEGAQMLVVGGFGMGSPQEVWRYRPTGNSSAWLSPPGPPAVARGAHSAAWDTIGSRVLLFTGYRAGQSNDLWSFRPSGNAWTRPAPRVPQPSSRHGHAAVWDSLRGQMLLFGGYRGGTQFLDDLWSYRPALRSWTPLTPSSPRPQARSEHSAVWDEQRERMLLFGGYGSQGWLNDLWAFEPSSGQWSELAVAEPRPPPREEHAAAWDSLQGRLLVFGGARDGRPLADLWSWESSTGTWSLLDPEGPGPAPRHRHSALWDAARGHLLVFGGYGGISPGSYLNDLWAYDPVTNRWTELAPTQTGPSPRARHATVWDSARDRMLLLGGYAGGVDYLLDLWSYDAASGSWTRLAPSDPPPARAGHRAVWDPRAARMHVFGGQAGALYEELWTYED